MPPSRDLRTNAGGGAFATMAVVSDFALRAYASAPEELGRNGISSGKRPNVASAMELA